MLEGAKVLGEPAVAASVTLCLELYPEYTEGDYNFNAAEISHFPTWEVRPLPALSSPRSGGIRSKVREADDGIKPGVERSGTPGSRFEKSKPAERPTAESSRLTFCNLTAIGRFAGSASFGC
jgi:hypothetical protein